MQSLTFITFMVSQKIATSKFMYHTEWAAGKPNTDHYKDSHFSCESKSKTAIKFMHTYKRQRLMMLHTKNPHATPHKQATKDSSHSRAYIQKRQAHIEHKIHTLHPISKQQKTAISHVHTQKTQNTENSYTSSHTQTTKDCNRYTHTKDRGYRTLKICALHSIPKQQKTTI